MWVWWTFFWLKIIPKFILCRSLFDFDKHMYISFLSKSKQKNHQNFSDIVPKKVWIWYTCLTGIRKSDVPHHLYHSHQGGWNYHLKRLKKTWFKKNLTYIDITQILGNTNAPRLLFWIRFRETFQVMNRSECDICMNFDTNEYPNIFVSRKWHEQISEYIHMKFFETNEYTNIFVSKFW